MSIREYKNKMIKPLEIKKNLFLTNAKGQMTYKKLIKLYMEILKWR